MDREKVAAGIAVKHKDVLPFLGKSESLDGLQFGYDFIEKFIQIPFYVPVPDKVEVKNYLAALSKAPVSVVRRTNWTERVWVWVYGEGRRTWRNIVRQRTEEATQTVAAMAAIDDREQANLRVTEDSIVFRETFPPSHEL